MDLEILKIRDCEIIDELTQLWQASVEATHHFLTPEDILRLVPTVRMALKGIETLVVSREGGDCQAFLGVAGDKIEMLFAHPKARGKGLGKKLVHYAVEEFGVRYVDVNEQNGEGVGFYLHIGFTQFDRSETDDDGNPFPILHMQLRATKE